MQWAAATVDDADVVVDDDDDPPVTGPYIYDAFNYINKSCSLIKTYMVFLCLFS